MNTEMQKRALAARDAHLALRDPKRVVDKAAQSTHAAELEAVHLAISPRHGGDISSSLRDVLERLGSSSFEALLSEPDRACKRPCPESESPRDRYASLLPRCSDYGDHFLVCQSMCSVPLFLIIYRCQFYLDRYILAGHRLYKGAK